MPESGYQPMTRLYSYERHAHELAGSQPGSPSSLSLTRRDFLGAGVVLLSGAVLPRFLAQLAIEGSVQDLSGTRIYLAPDDHTDLFFSADLTTYKQAFIDMLD